MPKLLNSVMLSRGRFQSRKQIVTIRRIRISFFRRFTWFTLTAPEPVKKNGWEDENIKRNVHRTSSRKLGGNLLQIIQMWFFSLLNEENDLINEDKRGKCANNGSSWSSYWLIKIKKRLSSITREIRNGKMQTPMYYFMFTKFRQVKESYSEVVKTL